LLLIINNNMRHINYIFYAENMGSSFL